jgi:hypothetical protein
MILTKEQEKALCKLYGILDNDGVLSEAESEKLLAEWYHQYDGEWFDEWMFECQWQRKYGSRH